MSDDSTTQVSEGDCSVCSSPNGCACPDGSEACAKGGACSCDPAVCFCAGGGRRQPTGCLGGGIRFFGSWPGMLVIAVAIIVVGAGLVCATRPKDSGPAVLSPEVSQTPVQKTTAPATATQAPAGGFNPFSGDLASTSACEPVAASQRGQALAGSKIECIGVLAGELDSAAAETASQSTGLRIEAGQYLAVLGKVNGTGSQIGLGITPAGAAVNEGSTETVDPIGAGGVTVAAFGDKAGWSAWPLLDAAHRFSPTGRVLPGRIDGDSFTILVPESELGAEIEEARLVLQSFVRKTPPGEQPSASDPVGATGFRMLKLMLQLKTSPRREPPVFFIVPSLVEPI